VCGRVVWRRGSVGVCAAEGEKDTAGTLEQGEEGARRRVRHCEAAGDRWNVDRSKQAHGSQRGWEAEAEPACH
jgi:hypothetical protein